MIFHKVNGQRWVQQAELARNRGVDDTAVYKACLDGRLKSIKLDGMRLILWDQAAAEWFADPVHPTMGHRTDLERVEETETRRVKRTRFEPVQPVATSGLDDANERFLNEWAQATGRTEGELISSLVTRERERRQAMMFADV